MRAHLRLQSLPRLLLLRLLVGLIRLLFDIPLFFIFLVTGRIRE